MKVTLENKSKVVPELTFPCLRAWKDNPDLIVLFTSPTVGTVVRGTLNRKVGDYDTVWDSNSKNWIHLEGRLILEND